ncbi:hypothetical protein [Thorsellia anophelis]|uniref:Uncharacterized protein n=1 Tax=Thorsellia anophelis DSM 18579 TaxID=1123402 RepID=A0A1I0FQL7_9GAMM|nr:hypothetical protein [Thorsellia anophelis]SET60677.1 hypothetical protein SAMN02583745_02862 [Thorsellia anophelis DSM 18579]
MKKNIFCYFLLFIIMFSYSFFSSAGVKGYSVVFFDLSNEKKGKEVFLKTLHSSRELSSILSKTCWENRTGDYIRRAYINEIPEGINSTELTKIISGDKIAIKKIQSILLNYRDDDILQGFDGMYIYNEINGYAYVFGFPKYGKNIITAKVNLQQKEIDIKNMDLLFCNASATFDSYFGP